VVEFTGFQAEAFELFSLPDFASRMEAIRSTLRPTLQALGQDLCGPLEEILGAPLFPHVAQHMRRRVNPPEETWTAFARDRRGYKRWAHCRLAVSGRGVRATFFVEDDADDKPRFGAALAGSAAEILARIGPEAPVEWYTLGDSGPLPHARVTPATLEELGARLQRLKTLKFQAGVSLPREEALRMAAEQFETWTLGQFRLLKPLYAAALPP